MRRLETTIKDEEESGGTSLPDDDVDLIVNAIAQRQQASVVCIGCQQSGHFFNTLLTMLLPSLSPNVSLRCVLRSQTAIRIFVFVSRMP